MTQSDATRKGSDGTRLPSVVPEKVQRAKLDNEQLAVANEFFASLDPDQIVVAEKKAAIAIAVATPKPNLESPDGEVVAELDTPLEEIWDETLNEALGSELQQALPAPVVRPAKPKVSRSAIPMARRARKDGIEIQEREDEPFRFRDLLTRKGLKKNMGFLISLFLHTLLLLFLSLLVVRSGIGDSRLFLDAGEAPAAPNEELLNDVNVNPVVFENDDPADIQANDLLEEILDTEKSEEILKLDDITENDRPNGGFVPNQRTLGDGKSATFFGTKASGRRFVFVVDRSISMEYGSENFRSRELFNRYDVAKSELLSAIETLQPHQEFFVVMFADDTIPMFGERSVEESGDTNFDMIAATPQNKARFQNWLSEVGMGPGTDPRNAVEIAISMEPDAIFMLSDGAFYSERRDGRPKTRHIIDKHASQGTIVPINTVSLVVEETIETMEGIAKRSGGSFRFTTILDYVNQVANLRGPMRTRALEQLVSSANTWEERESIITKRLLPMLYESSGVERANAENLLQRATMGFFEHHVDSVFRSESNAMDRWDEIVREIDGFRRTEQVSALGQGRELEQKILLAMLEQKDEHREFGSSPQSVGWLRELISRLNGKKPKERSQLARVNWSPEQAQAAIDRLFEERGKRARVMYEKYADPQKGASFKDRIGKALVKKYPETPEAGRVRQVFARQHANEVPPDLVGDEDLPEDPFTQ